MEGAMRTAVLAFVLAVPLLATADEAAPPDPPLFRLVDTNTVASCTDFVVHDASGAFVSLPPDASEALKCPAVLDLHGAYLTYMHQWKITRLDLKTLARVELFSVFPDPDGVEGPRWSPDGRSMLFRIVDQQKRNGYKESSRLIVVTVRDGEIVAKRKFDRFVNFQCGSTCGSIHDDDFGFRDDDTLFYRRHWASPERPGEIDEIEL